MTLRPFGLHVALLTLALVAGPASASQAGQPPSTPAPQRPPNSPAPPAAPRAATAPATPAPATAAPPAPAAPAAAPAPRRVFQSLNIKIDLSIADERSGSPPVKRALSLVVADGGRGSIRTQSDMTRVGAVPLNVDALPELLPDGKVMLDITVQYDWPAPPSPPATPEQPLGPTVVKTALHDNVKLVLESGKPMVVAQSADPIGDRQVTVEVKATVLK